MDLSIAQKRALRAIAARRTDWRIHHNVRNALKRKQLITVVDATLWLTEAGKQALAALAPNDCPLPSSTQAWFKVVRTKRGRRR